MTIWVTSDTHFGHGNIIKYCKRPFTSIEEMDAKLIKNWNTTIRMDDLVYHLGDFAFGSQRFHAETFDKLNGNKVLIAGNHDHHARKLGWMSIHDYMEINYEGSPLTLCHYPFAVWNGSHHGAVNLHGHSHGTYPASGHQLDVGVDCHAYKPLAISEAIRLALNNTRAIKDHHVGRR